MVPGFDSRRQATDNAIIALRLLQRIEFDMIKLMALVLTLSSAAAIAHEAPLSAWDGGAKGGDREGKEIVVSDIVVKAPEMDTTAAASALTLLLGGVLVMRSRATKR
jgi:hypothetical protein